MQEVLQLSDPAALRALAHPLRVRLLGLLREHGPGTATTLAHAVGESTGDTSYHLRQLARYGLVVPVPDRGRGRERWWAAAARHFELPGDASASPALRAASRALRDEILARDARILATFLAEEASEPAEVPTLFTNEVLYLTAAEAEQVGRRLQEALAPFVRRDPADRPAGARRVYLAVHAVPWEP